MADMQRDALILHILYIFPRQARLSITSYPRNMFALLFPFIAFRFCYYFLLFSFFHPADSFRLSISSFQ